MTKEELKQEAELDAGNVNGFDISTTLMVAKDKADAYRLGRFDGYLAGAELREKCIAELKEKNEKSNVLLADIIEAFTSCSYNDDFEMAQAGKEIYELFNGGKDPKEVFHNAEVPKCSRQLLKEAKEIIKACMDIMIFHDCEYTDAFKQAKEFIEEYER